MKSIIFSTVMMLYFVASAAIADTYVLETYGGTRVIAKHGDQNCKYGGHVFQPGDTVIQKNGGDSLNMVCAKFDGGGILYVLSSNEIVAVTAKERSRVLVARALHSYMKTCGGCTRKQAELALGIP